MKYIDKTSKDTVEWGRVITKQTDSYIIVDNFLKPEHFKLMKDKVCSLDMLWQMNLSISDCDDKKTLGTKLSYGFNRTYAELESGELFNDGFLSGYVYALNSQIKKFFNLSEETKFIRTRFDMTTYKGEETFTFSPHVDVYGEHLTSIFYFHTTDAPTVLYNEIADCSDLIDKSKLTVMEEVECIENRVVIFYGKHIHTGKSLTSGPRRILMNTNFSIPPETLEN